MTDYDALNRKMQAEAGTAGAPPANDSASDEMPLASPPELAPAALYGAIGDWVQLVAPHTEASPAALLGSALTAVGALIGRSPSCTLDGARHGVNLFLLLVGPTSSGRKGTAVARARRLLRELDGDFAHRNVVAGLSSGEGIIHAIRDASPGIGDKPGDPGVPDKRLLVVEGEFSAVLRRMRREGNTLSALLREAWDGYTLGTLTKITPQKATNPHMAVIAQITPEELLRHLEDADYFGGFLNRFLPVWAERTQLLPFASRADEREQTRVIGRLSRATVTARARTALDDLTPAGADWWAAHYAQLTTGHSGRVGAATQRGAAQMRRLALLYAVLDGVHAVDVPHLEAAFALWQYAVASAGYIFGRSELSPDAQRLAAALLAAGPDGLDMTAIREEVFGSHNVSASKRRAVLVEVRDAGLAQFHTAQTSGRPREVWVHVQHLRPKNPAGRNGHNGREGEDHSAHIAHNAVGVNGPAERPLADAESAETPHPASIVADVADRNPLPRAEATDQEAREERAAIMEFDGGLSRAEAERRAGLAQAAAEPEIEPMAPSTTEPPPADRCPRCGGPLRRSSHWGTYCPNCPAGR